MKPEEQDAAHSFDKETCPTCGNAWGDEKGKYCSSPWHLATPYIMNQLRECKSEVQLFKEALITRDGNLTNKSMLDDLTRLRSELQQKDEVINELVEAVEKLLRVDSFRGGFPYTTKVFESVIQKSKAK